MKRLKYFFLAAVALCGLTVASSIYAAVNPYTDGPFTLLAETSDAGPKTEFSPALPTTDVWTIKAETTYKGTPVHDTWGSRLFSASGDDKLNFYMRPPVGWPGATDSNTGKLLLNNAAFTDVLDIDTENGTLFHFEIISDGTGKVVATARVNGITYTKVWSTEIGNVSFIYAGQKYETTATVTQGAKAIVLPTSPSAFGSVLLGENKTQDISVYGISTTGNFSYTVGGADAAAFEVTGNTDATQTNTLTIKFSPTEAKTYNATLTVSGGGEGVEPVTVRLTGVGIELPVELSTSETPDANDKWYYIYNNKRMPRGLVFEDKDATIKQAFVIEENPNNNQLWKIIKVANGQYQFINKGTSNKINISGSTISTAATSASTFSFIPGTGGNAGFWVIYSNDALKSINKNNGDDIYGLYGTPNADDPGNCVQFVKENEAKGILFPAIELSTGETPDASDKWYYIYNNRRMADGQVFEDKDGTIKQTIVTEENPNNNQLWKIINKSNNQYQFINKGTGNKINIDGSTISTAATSASTFKFIPGLGDNTGFWVIYSNDASKSINKGSPGDSYSLWGNPEAGDPGNCVQFVKENEAKGILYLELPLLSTDEDEHWYQIQFNRRLTKAIENVPEATVLKQVALADKTAQYWKITGTSHDDCKIESYSGQEIAGNGGNKYTAVEKGNGNSFKFERGVSPLWQLYNNTTAVNGAKYLNDDSGSEVTGYSKNDAGAYLNFISKSPVPEFTTSVSAIDYELVPLNEGAPRTLSVAGRNLSGTITYELDGADKAAFAVTPAEGWSTKRGGNLTVTFTPTDVRTFSATLLVKTDGQEDIAVALSGAGTSDPILYATPTTLAFGDVTTGLNSETETITVSGAYLTGDIAYAKNGADAAAFVITESLWTAAAGGTLSVVFHPTEAKDYSATIEIASSGAEPKTIALTGTGVVTELPVTLSTDDSEVWYYVEVNKRTGQYYQDLGASKALEIRPAIPEEDGQLWKVVSTGISGKYQLISKAGNQIAYTATALEEGAIAADRFYTKAASDATYSFAKREDGNWQIRWNEGETYVNKAQITAQLTNNQFGKYNVLPDDGSSVIFVPVADIEFHLPVFSTDDASTWYYINFQKERTANTDLVVQGNGENQVITQNVKAVKGNQLWKFTGSWDNCKITNPSGLEWKLSGDSYQLVAAGSGDAHKLYWNIAANEIGWRLINKSVETANNPLINDYQQANPHELRMWREDSNPGNAFDFVPAEVPFDFVIEATAEASANDYNPTIFEDIIFKSTDAATGQLKDIPAGGLTVNGAVKVEKTFTFGKDYSIGFPFTIPTLPEGDCMLKSYNGTTNLFGTATAIEAGAGYLIQFPAPEEATETTVTVTFVSADNISLPNPGTLTVPAGYSLVANPYLTNVTQQPGEGDAFYLYDYANAAFALPAADVPFSVKPFEALVTVKDVTGSLYENIGGGIVESLGNVDANDPVVTIKYYTLQGIEVQQLSEKSVYIIKKVHASQKVSVSKVLYKK